MPDSHLQAIKDESAFICVYPRLNINLEPDTPAPEDQKNPHAVALGKLGGSKGGPARAKKLSPEERSEISRKAAKARWEKAKKSLLDE